LVPGGLLGLIAASLVLPLERQLLEFFKVKSCPSLKLLPNAGEHLTARDNGGPPLVRTRWHDRRNRV
jgi:hypothetical protein